MTHEKVYIQDLHSDHSTWFNELTFYKDELRVLQARLDEVAAKNTDKEMKAIQGQLQSKIIRQKDILDVLEHEIQICRDELVKYAKNHPVALDHVLFTDHAGMREKMDSFKSIYADMKADFQRFVAEWI